MNNVKCYCVVIVLFGINVSSFEVSSLDIECVPLKNCSLLMNNILAQGRISSESILKFLNSIICGVDDKNPKKVKVWCNHFKNCKTSESRKGIWSNIQDAGKVREKRSHHPRSMSRHRHFHDNHFGFFNERQFNENETENDNDYQSPFKGGNDKHNHRPVGHWWKHQLLDAEKKDEDICFTPGNLKGFCKEIHQCSNIVNILKSPNRLDNKAVEYLKKFKCQGSTQSIIKVCCPEEQIIMPDVNPPVIETRVKTTVDNNLECGRAMITDRIVSGTTASLSEFPWTALLQYNTSKGFINGCGGSVINKRYVITAAHCVNEDILGKNGLQSLNRLVLGEYDTRNETDCIYTKFGSDCADPPEYFNFERIIVHESFSSNGTANDIALIRVDRDIQFTNYIKPICLPAGSSFRLKGNENFSITGWGRTESGNVSPVKKKARLPFVDKARCSQLGPLGAGQMCLGSDKRVDSCKGDSGGPVMNAAVSEGEVVTTLVGIISYGFGTCGTTTSVCTYVPFYLDWISHNLEE
ncbi:unnamed protein product [Ceutorhynchus assimilis]|uniref:CLIP domain-containing serine protease n=1 Tax=Ceutorhynchus assimilis TaxID=467358 RepID=A0A9N9MQ36_9CUCU|nr:unnamed protein product [Ceutorhynchus assimilis]